MPSDFNPYYFFLGIPPRDQPVDHYRLLGLEQLESNLQIIEMAADRQMGHLQRYESGEHVEQVAKLMSEVARARLCLLSPKRKAEYDKNLQAKLEAQEKKEAAAPDAQSAPPDPKPAKQPHKPTDSPVAERKPPPLPRFPAPKHLAPPPVSPPPADDGIVTAAIVPGSKPVPPIRGGSSQSARPGQSEPAWAIIVEDEKPASGGKTSPQPAAKPTAKPAGGAKTSPQPTAKPAARGQRPAVRSERSVAPTQRPSRRPAGPAGQKAQTLPQAKRLASGQSQPLVNSVGMQFAFVPAGDFMMGSPATEAERGHNEFLHPVSMPRAFHLGLHPVTQEQYRHIQGINPSCFAATGLGRVEVRDLDTRAFPVELVSWIDATEFCRRLSEMPEERAAGRIYRLPTEAEWEYACRGGTTTVFAFGNGLASTQANFNGMPYGSPIRGPNLARPSTVGSYAPNAWGLYDMHGNVWEWCQDWYYAKHSRPTPDPTARVIRGGCWKGGARACRSASRFKDLPANRNASTGFRVVVELSE